ncbi:Adenylate/guanylate cyclase [Candidatus Syntrophocurvum alkaliphilum]|uniref:Adenylate/guanylate cyclase n=1 Tax=Candidatus Syntrophocurvum alkaliphilum TaxID=2293317 RepID=A0A6I6DGQ6_9FIRM|nr:HD domain-containing phosphohydrolase [Candidatus Syntrophocurvum alkaliphilum]QGT99570.1 Adenylate/guanylate cyclase [Candidatus Syntrophocurvum alkaliphilum]
MHNHIIENLKVLSLMHDIGKIAISDSILNKPGRLNKKECFEMKKHTEIGHRIAEVTPEFSHIAHERFDGKGYPQGLKGLSIPLESRILAIVDAYDAMTNDRAYRKAMSCKKAIQEITKNSGTQFDPLLVKVFTETIIDEKKTPKTREYP